MKNLSSIISRAFFALLAVMALTASLSLAQTTEKLEWEEDRERPKQIWENALSPEEYIRALEATGQLRALHKTGATTDTDWIPIGPTGNLNNNSQQEIGRIRTIHIQSIGSDYYIYVGGSSGGLWRARGSAGPVWTSLGDRLPNPAVSAIAVHPNNPDEILVGTGDYQRYKGAGMFHTTDAGQTWTKVSLPVSPEPEAFFKIYYLPGNPNIILVASSVGLFRSESGVDGRWITPFNSLVSDLIIHPTDPNIQYCCRQTINGVRGGIYKSIDAGRTWEPIFTTGAPANAFGQGRIAICRSAPDNIVFMYDWENHFQGIKRSTDGGIIWTDITGGLRSSSAANTIGNNLAIAIRPNNPNEIYIGMVALWKSTVGGTTWDVVDQNLIQKHFDQTQIYFSPVTGDNVAWFCNDGGVYRWIVGTGNSNSWNGNASTGLRVTQIYQLDAQRDFRVAAFQDVGIAGSINMGSSWTPFRSGDGDEVEITDDMDMVQTFWHIGGLSVVPPTWRVFRQPFSGPGQYSGSLGTESYRKLFFDQFSNRIYSVNTDGSPFHVVSSPTPGTLAWREEHVLSNRAKFMAGSYLNGNALFAWDENSNALTVLQRAGTSWSPSRVSFAANTKITTVFASTEQPGESWAGLGSITPGTPRILHTTDFWQTSTNITGTLSNVGAVNAIVVRPFNSKEIFVGTDVGMFWTQNGGASWEPFQSGLPLVRCTDLRYIVDRTRGGNDKLVVSTFGRGLYERTITRPPLVYVDPRNTSIEDGTYEHPFNTFNEGLNATPNNGILALHGNIYAVPAVLNRPMTINAYESPAQLRR